MENFDLAWGLCTYIFNMIIKIQIIIHEIPQSIDINLTLLGHGWTRSHTCQTSTFIREVLLHVKRERVRVEMDRRVWRHQNMCTL